MFAILFEVLLIEFKRQSIILLVGRAGSRGTKIVNKNFVNKLAFPSLLILGVPENERVY